MRALALLVALSFSLLFAKGAEAALATVEPVWAEVEPLARQEVLNVRNRDVGPCVCDLTRDACDLNCRCDSECSQEQRALFTSSDPEGPVTTDAFKCVDRDLVKVNERGGLTTSIVDNMLCIEKINKDEKDYFVDPGTVSDARLDEVSAERGGLSFRPARAARQDAQDHYKVDEPVRGALLVGGVITPLRLGLMSLPAAGLAGECADLSAPRFGRDVRPGPAARCTRYAPALATDCAAAFSSDRYVASLRVATAPDSAPSVAGDWLAPTVASVRRRDPATGAETDLGAVPVPAPAFAAGACSNALLAVHYDLAYDEGGRLTSVAASVVVGTVTAAAASQQFTVSFAPDGAPATRSPRSGNPGYRRGLPLLAGSEVTSAGLTAVRQLVGGLQVLPHTATGECDVAGELRHAVQFGVDARLGCTLFLDRAALQVACDVANVVPLLDLGAGLFGFFGDADLNARSQWGSFEVADAPAPETARWDAAAGRCTLNNVLALELMTADVGAADNPQRKVVRARASYTTTDDWVFTAADPAEEQGFSVLVTVTYVHARDPDLEAYVPPAPPVLPRLPRDVLYPLYVDS